MAEPSKILTVSYGTFSCTLEGFDDAFETMKAIAEYFRDLAAEDRYFGAEPPTPDPEMLARIAERDIERRVEARLSDSGYVLRPAALAGAAAASSDTSVADLGKAAPVEGPASDARDIASATDAEEDAAATPVTEDEAFGEEAEAPVDDAIEAVTEDEAIEAVTEEDAVEAVNEDDTVEAVSEDDDAVSDARDEVAEEVGLVEDEVANDEPETLAETAADEVDGATTELEAIEAGADDVVAEDEAAHEVAEVSADEDSDRQDAAEAADDEVAADEHVAEAEEAAEATDDAASDEVIAEVADVDAEAEQEAAEATDEAEVAEVIADDDTAEEETRQDSLDAATEDEAEEALDPEEMAEAVDPVVDAAPASEDDAAEAAQAETSDADDVPDQTAEPETTAEDETSSADTPDEGYDPDEDKRPWSDLTMTERRLRRQARRARRAEEEAKAAEVASRAPKPAALTETRDINERRGLMRRFSDAGKSVASGAAPAGAGSVTTEPLKDMKASETAADRTADTDERPLDQMPVSALHDAETAAPDQDMAAGTEPTVTAPQGLTSGESVAAKLARIRAVVGNRDDRATSGEEDERDTSETPSAERTDASIPETGAEAKEWSEAQPATEDSTDDRSDSDAETEADDTGAADDDGRSPSRVRARVIRMRRSDYDAQSTGTGWTAEEDASEDEEALEELAEAEDQADLARLDARPDMLPDVEDLADGGLDGEMSTLSPEDEADLLEELAEVERLAGPAAADDARAEPTGRAALLARSPDADAEAVDRILTETDAQLKEPEGNRRREAIAHLKAAVAATEAARQLGEDDGLDDGENMFREDLDQVVRPRRTARPELRSDRPRPAPLKLVASQRVDAVPVAPPAEPVMPRRVQAGASAEPAGGDVDGHESFAAFADDMGATGLADLLEAAAAHAAFVDGEEDVSRPQLMKMVTAVMPGGFSREDGLRAFGTLLRQGRIEKVRNGRFRISAQSRFNPRRAASGV